MAVLYTVTEGAGGCPNPTNPTCATGDIPLALGRAECCGIIAAKTTQHAARAAARGIGIGANASLVLNESYLIKFLSRFDKTGFIKKAHIQYPITD